MAPQGRFLPLLASFFALSSALLAEKPETSVREGPPLVGWRVPTSYAPPPTHSRIRALGDISNPVPFITIAPCRQYNSLSATPLLQGVNRAVTLTGAPCGIPSSAVAVSVNITVFNITGATGNGVFKVDTVSPPAVAWINYPPTETQRANAGAVALNGSGQIIVQVAQGAGQIDFVVDVNGYASPTPATAADPFIVSNTSGTAAIIGNNASAASYASGVLGHITANPAGGFSAGVRGQNDGTGVDGIGVYGSQNGSGIGVYGSAPSGAGVYGFSTSNIGTYGESTSGTGAYGISQSNNGVLGRSFGSGLSVAGVWGTSTDAIGTYGFSTNSNGVWAQSTNLDALAAFGGRNGGFLQGAQTGVIGMSTSTATGVFGVEGIVASTNSNAAGVYGISGSTLGSLTGCCGAAGVRGENAFVGVLGLAKDRATIGVLVDGSGNKLGEGWLGKSGGSATQSWGVYGFLNGSQNAAGGAGVKGIAFDGEAPGNTNQPPSGVFGTSSANYGVLGTSRGNGFAVTGFSVDNFGAIQAGGYLGYDNGTGILYLNGLTGTGTKNFIEPHPTDASKLIKYVSIEGPEAGVYFRGRGQAHHGLATIEVPEDFRMVASEEGLSIQVTPIGETANVAVLQIGLDRIVVKATQDVEFFYTVNGVRRAYPNWNPIQENRKEFVPEGPDARLPAYLSANERQRLIDNGTYRPDGTVNMETARRTGWEQLWQAKAEEAARRKESPR